MFVFLSRVIQNLQCNSRYKDPSIALSRKVEIKSSPKFENYVRGEGEGWGYVDYNQMMNDRL